MTTIDNSKTATVFEGRRRAFEIAVDIEARTSHEQWDEEALEAVQRISDLVADELQELGRSD
jgi:hypothetical protein